MKDTPATQYMKYLFLRTIWRRVFVQFREECFLVLFCHLCGKSAHYLDDKVHLEIHVM